MTQASSKSAAGTVSATVVDPSDHDAPAYGMFTLEELAESGAFLAGAIFFEQGEEFTVELSAEGHESVRVRAKVTAHQRTPSLGMQVSFPGLSAAERKAITGLASGL